jgi:hypothetical protein
MAENVVDWVEAERGRAISVTTRVVDAIQNPVHTITLGRGNTISSIYREFDGLRARNFLPTDHRA